MKGSPESGPEKPTYVIGINSVPNPSHGVNIPHLDPIFLSTELAD
jgi:hypothetical protein